MSKGHDPTEKFCGDIHFLLIGENRLCKCLVGNKIIGYEQFLPEQPTSDVEISLQIGSRWITVIQEPEAVIQGYMETCSCIILLVLQQDHVSQKDMETFARFQQKFEQKIEENIVVVLVSSEDKTSVTASKETNENLDSILYLCGRKVCVFRKNLKQWDLIKQLIACCKSASQLPVHKHERSSHRTTPVEREISNPQEPMAQEHISGGNQAAIKKKNTLTIVLLGQTGSGKSATGNTILRNRHFESHASSVPVTQVCQMAEETANGIKIRVIDTPDFFDEDLKNQQEQIKKCKELGQPRPDVYLLVMELGRYTDGERGIVQNLQRAFGADMVKETIVLFTRKEKLRGKTVSEYIKNTDTQLQDLIRNCGSRYHAFNNNDHNVSQVERLIEMILEMKRKNGNPDILEQYSYSKEPEKKDCRIQ